MDSLTLEVQFKELKSAIIDQSIQKLRMVQDQLETITLKLRSNAFLVIRLHQSQPIMFLSNDEVVATGKVSPALSALRKHLTGGRIRAVRKELTDRIIYIEIENYQHTHHPVSYTLVAELIPPRPDLLLLNHAGTILATLRREIESVQSVSSCYQPPFPKPALSLESAESQEFGEAFKKILSLNQETGRKAMCQALGVSPAFLREMTYGVELQAEACLERLRHLLDRIRNGSYSPHLYHLKLTGERYEATELKADSSIKSVNEGKGRWLVTPFGYDSLRGYSFSTYLSMNEAFRALFERLHGQEKALIQEASRRVSVQASLKKKLHLLDKLHQDLRRFQGAETYKKFADLLYAQPQAVYPGKTSLRMSDLFDPLQTEIEIPLNPRLNLIQNANLYSQRFQKANRAIPLIAGRIKSLEADVAVLQNQSLNLQDADTSAHVPAERLAPEEGSIKRNDGKRVPKATAKVAATHQHSALQERKVARRFISTEGLLILVGKTSRDNDTLTLKIARNEDFWLHVAGYGGSHVILRNPERLETPPRQSLLEAAQLAAYFSQARNAPKVEVHFAQKKMVSKPKRAKAGLVLLKEYKSLMVQPKLLGEPD